MAEEERTEEKAASKGKASSKVFTILSILIILALGSSSGAQVYEAYQMKDSLVSADILSVVPSCGFESGGHSIKPRKGRGCRFVTTIEFEDEGQKQREQMTLREMPEETQTMQIYYHQKIDKSYMVLTSDQFNKKMRNSALMLLLCFGCAIYLIIDEIRSRSSMKIQQKLRDSGKNV